MPSHFISLHDAAAMTRTFRAERENILDAHYKGRDILMLSETFDRGDLDSLLSQADCVSFRIYLSMDTNLLVKAVLVGVNSNNEDILTPGSELIMEQGERCPPMPVPQSALNS
jgi:hypothetical protein